MPKVTAMHVADGPVGYDVQRDEQEGTITFVFLALALVPAPDGSAVPIPVEQFAFTLKIGDAETLARRVLGAPAIQVAQPGVLASMRPAT